MLVWHVLQFPLLPDILLLQDMTYSGLTPSLPCYCLANTFSLYNDAFLSPWSGWGGQKLVLKHFFWNFSYDDLAPLFEIPSIVSWCPVEILILIFCYKSIWDSYNCAGRERHQVLNSYQHLLCVEERTSSERTWGGMATRGQQILLQTLFPSLDSWNWIVLFNSQRPGGAQVLGHVEGLSSPGISSGSSMLILLSDFLQSNHHSSSWRIKDVSLHLTVTASYQTPTL